MNTHSPPAVSNTDNHYHNATSASGALISRTSGGTATIDPASGLAGAR